MSSERSLVTTQALAELCAGDSSAASRLLPLVYDELRAIAAHYFKRQPSDHTLQPTALVHEAYLKLIGQGRSDWQGRAHFLGVAAMAMRQILIGHARERGAAKRGGSGWRRITLDRVLSDLSSDAIDVVSLDEALTKLGSLNGRHARVVELRVFGGLTVEEAAHILQVSDRTVKNDWQFATAWLKRELSAGESPDGVPDDTG